MTVCAIPASVLSRARQLGSAIEDRVNGLGGRQIRVDATELITGRAALRGLGPPTRISSSGASRLLATADGWCALTLSRTEDHEAVPALLEMPTLTGDRWGHLESVAATRQAAAFVERARLLDLPAAVLGEVAASEPNILQHNATSARTLPDLLVVDMSSMWAGPLCGRLLAAAGATVVKVETTSRPDGTRSGEPRFFDWMNSEKLSYSVNFDTEDFVRLLRAADVVIEGSRPAALARRGLSADKVPARPGRVWLRLSGYGRDHPQRVAFGDDAAVAGGLVILGARWSLGQASLRENGPWFCGDAIADPLTGLAAAAAVLDELSRGGGSIVDISMAAVAATFSRLPDRGIDEFETRMPQRPAQVAHKLGADNDRVRELIEARLAAC